MQCSSARCMVKSPESSKRTEPFARGTTGLRRRSRPRWPSRAVRAGTAIPHDFLRSFNRAKRSHARAAASWAARSISSRPSRSRAGPASPHSPLECPTPAGSHSSLEHLDPPRASHSSLEHPVLVGITSAARPPEGHRKHECGRGMPDVRIHVSGNHVSGKPRTHQCHGSRWSRRSAL